MRRVFVLAAAALLLATALPARAGRDGEIRKALQRGDFQAVEAMAEGQTVRFYMFGGFAHVNRWVDTYVAENLKSRHGVTLKRVPMDASVSMNKLITEKAAGKEDGSIDLVWINGENFRNAMQAGLLFGPFVRSLPNFQYVDPATAAYDFGYPVRGHEAPYGKAQFVMEYDAGRIAEPPRSVEALKQWIKAHPGRFTYPRPPDFTGSAFIRQVFYALSGGHEQYMDGFDQELYDRRAPKLWAWLNEVAPYLWREGRAYPRDSAMLDTLFSRGETDFSMSYHPAHAQTKIKEGVYPDSVRTYVFQSGSIYNTHYTAIPANSPRKAAALVAANFLLSPGAQLAKYKPSNWGDYPVLDLSRLPEAWREKFRAVDLGPATLPARVLEKAAVPEIPSAWLEALEDGWERHVLRR
jgi:putative spermidine/putrescine transport system substrate-binding protein